MRPFTDQQAWLAYAMHRVSCDPGAKYVERETSDQDVPRAAQSPYATELQSGRVALRFPKALEREYLRSHIDRTHSRARGWQSAVLLLSLATTIIHFLFHRTPGLSLDATLRVGILLPSCAVLTWAVWSPKYESWYPRVAFAGSLIVGVIASIVIAKDLIDGYVEDLTFLTSNIMGMFFLVGMLFFDAAAACLFSMIAFAIAAASFGLSIDKLIYDTALLGVVTCVGAYIAYGIEETNRRLFLERGVLGDLAERDGLTGLRNRRAFDEHLLRVWQQSLRDRSPLSVLMIDLDYFKNYNDHYGHQAGDECLRHVAQLVNRFARRPLDLAARYGGEELAIILYQVTREQAQTIAEQLRATIAAQHIEHRGSPQHGMVTVSIGVAWVEATLDRRPQDTVQIADEALYTAKLAGRNQMKFLGPDHAHGFTGTLKRTPQRQPYLIR